MKMKQHHAKLTLLTLLGAALVLSSCGKQTETSPDSSSLSLSESSSRVHSSQEESVNSSSTLESSSSESLSSNLDSSIEESHSSESSSESSSSSLDSSIEESHGSESSTEESSSSSIEPSSREDSQARVNYVYRFTYTLGDMSEAVFSDQATIKAEGGERVKIRGYRDYYFDERKISEESLAVSIVSLDENGRVEEGDASQAYAMKNTAKFDVFVEDERMTGFTIDASTPVVDDLVVTIKGIQPDGKESVIKPGDSGTYVVDAKTYSKIKISTDYPAKQVYPSSFLKETNNTYELISTGSFVVSLTSLYRNSQSEYLTEDISINVTGEFFDRLTYYAEEGKFYLGTGIVSVAKENIGQRFIPDDSYLAQRIRYSFKNLYVYDGHFTKNGNVWSATFADDSVQYEQDLTGKKVQFVFDANGYSYNGNYLVFENAYVYSVSDDDVEASFNFSDVSVRNPNNGYNYYYSSYSNRYPSLPYLGLTGGVIGDGPYHIGDTVRLSFDSNPRYFVKSYQYDGVTYTKDNPTIIIEEPLMKLQVLVEEVPYEEITFTLGAESNLPLSEPSDESEVTLIADDGKEYGTSRAYRVSDWGVLGWSGFIYNKNPFDGYIAKVENTRPYNDDSYGRLYLSDAEGNSARFGMNEFTEYVKSQDAYTLLDSSLTGVPLANSIRLETSPGTHLYFNLKITLHKPIIRSEA